MGAWGTGPLENDGALDWIDELSDGGLDFAAFREGCDAELDEGFISEHADGVLALVRVARILDGESEEDGLDEDIDRNALAAGLTPEFRLWLVEAGQKVINAEGSDLYDRWAATEDLNEWLGTAREDLDYLRTSLG
ncbi:DUF4259 domain-containing protein [Arthrobacter halodurans]|uniref:DUF4259 domain-containing protein n=1 Tax=Arthrobacter halodurans TaxID=516699 RepID=A0ABV4UTM5_9MICC